MRWRRWSLILVVVAAIGGLALVGRVVNLPEAEPPTSTVTAGLVSIATLPPPAAVPEALRRPLRLPGLRGDGSCPVSIAAGPPMTAANPVAAVAVGDGPVYPVLFRAAGGRLDRSAVAYWDAPEPLDGAVIVRGHRLGAPGDRVRFRGVDDQLRPTHVLDPAAAYPAADNGRWWPPTRLRAGAGCYGLQIDGPGFSRVLVVELG